MGMDQRLLKPSSGGTGVPLPAYYFQHEFNSELNLPALWMNTSELIYFRTPTLIKNPITGTILRFAGAMSTTTTDWSGTVAVCSRSIDNGRTFGPWKIFASPIPTPPSTFPQINNMCPAVDPVTGTFWVLYDTYSSILPLNTGSAVPNSGDPFPRAYATYSTDDGLTWSVSGPQATGSDITSNVFVSGDWGWAVFGPSAGIYKEYAPNKNRMIIAGNYRPGYLNNPARTGTVLPPFVHCVINDDHTLPPNPQSWVSGGRLTENANNQYSSEPAIVECKKGARKGELYINCRMVGNYTVRGSTRSTDGGMTWSDTVLDTYTLADTQGSMISIQGGNYIVLAHPIQSGFRRKMGVRYSTDNGETFSTPKEVSWTWAAYSALCETDDGYILHDYEKGDNGTYGIGDGATWANHIASARYSPRFLWDTTYGSKTQYHFNEFPSGVTCKQPADPYTLSIVDYGNTNMRIRPLGSGSILPTYVDGMRGDSALRIPSSGGVFLVLSESGNDIYQVSTGSFTFELGFRVPNGSSGVFLSTNLTNVISRFWQMKINQNGFIVGTVQNANSIGNRTFVTGTVPVNDGNWYFATLRRQTTSPRTLDLLVHSSGGTLLDSVSVTDATPTLASTNTPSPIVLLGGISNSTQKITVDLDILRFSRYYVSDSNLLASNYPKTPYAVIPTYPADIDILLPDHEPVTWLPGFRRDAIFYDWNRGYKFPDVPVSGLPADLITDLVRHTGYYISNAARHGPALGSGNLVGWVWDIKPDSPTFPYGWYGSGTIGMFDFIQGSGRFGLSIVAQFSTVPPTGVGFTGAAMLLDNRNSTSSNAGFSLSRDWAAKTITFGMSGTGVMGQTFTSTTQVPSGQFYHIVVTCSGVGTPVRMAINPISGDSSTIGFTDTLSNITGVIWHPSANELAVGGRTLRSAGCMHGSIVDFIALRDPIQLGEAKILHGITKAWAERLS